MQLVTAIIQPFMLDRLTRVLRKQGVTGYTVTELKGSGHNLGESPDYLHPHIKIEVAVNDEEVSAIMEVISSTVRTHQEGDGIIYSLPLDKFIKIDD